MLLTKKRIFVVEDDSVNLAIIISLLRREGATVFFARWAEDCHNYLLRNMPIDIILTDIRLPKNLTGYDVFDSIRQIPELASIPIAAVTASNADDEINRARRKGFTGFITKPLRMHTFSNYVEKIIRGESIWAVN